MSIVRVNYMQLIHTLLIKKSWIVIQWQILLCTQEHHTGEFGMKEQSQMPGFIRIWGAMDGLSTDNSKVSVQDVLRQYNIMT